MRPVDTVKLAFGAYHTKCWKLTDSQVVLHWINSKKSALKMWVRYRVIEINRLTDVDKWYYVDSKNMIADIGTRKGAKMSVRSDSNWICGLTWMEGGECDFPIKTLKEIVLENNEVGDLNKESIIKENWGLTCKIVSDEYKNRYDFSQYLIDPNRFRFKKVVRVMALVYLFVLKFMSKYGSRSNLGSNECTSQMVYKFPNDVPKIIKYCDDQYILTTGKYSWWSRSVPPRKYD